MENPAGSINFDNLYGKRGEIIKRAVFIVPTIAKKDNENFENHFVLLITSV